MEAHGAAPSKGRLLLRAVLLIAILIIELFVLVADKKDYIIPFLSKSQAALHAVDPFVVAKYWLHIKPTCEPPLFTSSNLWMTRPDIFSPPSAEEVARQAEYYRCLRERENIDLYGVFAVFSELSGLTLILAVLCYGLFATGWLYWCFTSNLPLSTGGIIPIAIGGTATLVATKYFLYTLVLVFGAVVAAVLWINALVAVGLTIFVKGRHFYHQIREAAVATMKASSTLKG